ncbi:MAG TPA: peptide deformylase, partial [Oceanithermus profundus]|nr:peptide deformylase [Oceanithermus profundus]HHO58067.1 peptide deformylase [Oceanithermus profundus]
MAEVLPIRLYGDPVLRRKARPVQDFSDLAELAENMVETMFE